MAFFSLFSPGRPREGDTVFLELLLFFHCFRQCS